MENFETLSLEPEQIPSTALGVSEQDKQGQFNDETQTELNMFGGYDHVTFYVSSANIIAAHFIKTFGFKPYCHMGLETGSKTFNCRVVKNGNVIIQFMSCLQPLKSTVKFDDCITMQEIHEHIATHGDSVKDVAFQVRDVELVFTRAAAKGATIIMDPITFKDQRGSITLAKLRATDDTIHTLVDRSNYSGFLPGVYEMDEEEDDDENDVEMDCIDHCVQNMGWNKMIKSCEFYESMFKFHRFWSVDEKQVYTEYSALKSTVMASPSEQIKMPINEPAVGLKTSQIEEFLEYYGSSGVQHIALKVDDIISTVGKMKKRGVDFITVPDKYYDNLKTRLENTKHPEFKESMDKIKEMGLLVDFDENGYLLQLFTRPLFDRPTIFFEIIQRRNHNGFGAGNFKGLFEILEEDQKLRGNLTDQVFPDELVEEDDDDHGYLQFVPTSPLFSRNDRNRGRSRPRASSVDRFED